MNVQRLCGILATWDGLDQLGWGVRLQRSNLREGMRKVSDPLPPSPVPLFSLGAEKPNCSNSKVFGLETGPEKDNKISIRIAGDVGVSENCASPRKLMVEKIRVYIPIFRRTQIRYSRYT